MRKEFIEKVRRIGTVDTKKYRYIGKIEGNRFTVKRLPVELLDTTAAYDEWEEVYKEFDLINDRMLIGKLYDYIGHDVADADDDIKNDYLTENTGRDGKDYLWYADETTNAIIDADGNITEDNSTIEELFC